jgi:hypothetical protein
LKLPILPWQMDDLTESEANVLFEYLEQVRDVLRKGQS